MSSFTPLSVHEVDQAITLAWQSGRATLSVQEYRSLNYYMCEGIEPDMVGTSLHLAMLAAVNETSTVADFQTIDEHAHELLFMMGRLQSMGIPIDEQDIAVVLAMHNTNAVLAGDKLPGSHLITVSFERENGHDVAVMKSSPIVSSSLYSSSDLDDEIDTWTDDDDREWNEFLAEHAWPEDEPPFEWDDETDPDDYL